MAFDVQGKTTILVAEKLGKGGLELLQRKTREMFESSRGRLKVVGREGVGIDSVDL
jgi:hypothetical protein